MTQPFVYAPQAQAELRAIVRYTAQQWGAAQARDYAGLIDAAATDLAVGHRHQPLWGGSEIYEKDLSLSP